MSEMPVWRCSTCGRVSQAVRRPRQHRRGGVSCGPFAAWQLGGNAASQTQLPALTRYRQSLLTSFQTCPRRTRASLELPGDLTPGYSGALADLGSVTHEVFAEILRTMYRHGETQMATQESVEVMYEVLARSDLVLPADEREDLLMFTLRFVEKPWDVRRILAIEQGLTAEIVCQDGQARTLTGRPDLLIADPPDGLIIVDFKSGRGQPKSPRQAPPEGETVTGKQYLSDRGHAQLDQYGLLVLRAYPQASRVILREVHLRSGSVREAVLGRDELEHVERELGVLMLQLERGVAEGPESKVWKPRPGGHCVRACPVARSCPIPVEQRGDGGIAGERDADDQASRFAVVDAQRQQLRGSLKAFHEQTGYAPRVADGKAFRWKVKPDGGRSFGMWEPESAEERARAAGVDQDAVDAMYAELARREAMA